MKSVFFKKYREIEDTGQLLYPGHSKIGIGDEVFGNDVFSNDVFFLGIGDDSFLIEISDSVAFLPPRIVRHVCIVKKSEKMVNFSSKHAGFFR